MRVLPAIDIQGGRCVRLLQGKFDRVTEYSDDPVEVAERFSTLPVQELHVVDLDGARTGAQDNASVIARIRERTPLAVQLGGGIRDRQALEHWFGLGVARCVVGSVAVTAPDRVGAWLDEFGVDRIVIALDVDASNGTPRVASHGWTRSTGATLWDCLETWGRHGAVQVLCTDIARDGAMAGPNIGLYAEILERYPALWLQASGGIRDVGDIEALRTAGVPAAITGRALLDGRITEAELGSFLQDA